jgi:hypothetical protein
MRGSQMPVSTLTWLAYWVAACLLAAACLVWHAVRSSGTPRLAEFVGFTIWRRQVVAAFCLLTLCLAVASCTRAGRGGLGGPLNACWAAGASLYTCAFLAAGLCNEWPAMAPGLRGRFMAGRRRTAAIAWRL